MPIPITCEFCEVSYRITDRAAGKTVRCKECGEPVDVPGAATRATGRSSGRTASRRSGAATRASRAAAPPRSNRTKRSSGGSSTNWIAIFAGGAVGAVILVGGIVALLMFTDLGEPEVASSNPVPNPYQATQFRPPRYTPPGTSQSQARIDQMQADMRRQSEEARKRMQAQAEENRKRMQEEMDRFADEARQASQGLGRSNGQSPGFSSPGLRPPSFGQPNSGRPNFRNPGMPRSGFGSNRSPFRNR
ncbi:MAG: hypothetical protein AB8G99_18685 [Planctomycetaceae bacterium]